MDGPRSSVPPLDTLIVAPFAAVGNGFSMLPFLSVPPVISMSPVKSGDCAVSSSTPSPDFASVPLPETAAIFVVVLADSANERTSAFSVIAPVRFRSPALVTANEDPATPSVSGIENVCSAVELSVMDPVTVSAPPPCV